MLSEYEREVWEDTSFIKERGARKNSEQEWAGGLVARARRAGEAAC